MGLYITSFTYPINVLPTARGILCVWGETRELYVENVVYIILGTKVQQRLFSWLKCYDAFAMMWIRELLGNYGNCHISLNFINLDLSFKDWGDFFSPYWLYLRGGCFVCVYFNLFIKLQLKVVSGSKMSFVISRIKYKSLLNTVNNTKLF